MGFREYASRPGATGLLEGSWDVVTTYNPTFNPTCFVMPLAGLM